jgi:hypothetical protein
MECEICWEDMKERCKEMFQEGVGLPPVVGTRARYQDGTMWAWASVMLVALCWVGGDAGVSVYVVAILWRTEFTSKPGTERRSIESVLTWC